MRSAESARIRTIIVGAAGRDFHNFNVCFRDNNRFEVVAFTASQIPGIEKRVYPAELAGPLYRNGIPIHSEDELAQLIAKFDARQVILAYSDLSCLDVMRKASIALASGADFVLQGPRSTMLRAKVPVISVCAVRTGAGKSTVARKVSDILRKFNRKVVVVRHPMPYGDLRAQELQRFATYQDLDRHNCTIEEREEYEPHIDRGNVVFAGVDYGKILSAAEKESDVILWDGGNNDMPFYRPNLHIVVADPLRPGHEVGYYPGEANVRMADVIVLNKVDSASPSAVEVVRRNVKQLNPQAVIVETASSVMVDDPSLVKDKRVLVVEDGPTVTHGDMAYGAGMMAARKLGARQLVDPRPFAVGSIKATFEKYRQLELVLPAMGYGDRQIKELEQTIAAVDCDVVVVATPIDIRRIIRLNKPAVRVSYEIEERSKPTLEEILLDRLKQWPS